MRSTELLSCLLLLNVSTFTSHAFPSMLVESRGGCLIELSTDEVIMNAAVVPYSDSSRPDLYLAAVVQEKDSGGKMSFQRGPISLQSSTETTTMQVTLVNPGEALPDVQYAIDILAASDDEEQQDGGVARFVHGGCDGNRRTHGRLADKQSHEVAIGPTLSEQQKEIRLVAAWAGGHEAVQLTQEFVILVEPASTNNKSKPNQQQAPFLEDFKEQPHDKGELVEGIQVVQKHEPKEVVDTVKLKETDVVVGNKDGSTNLNINNSYNETTDEKPAVLSTAEEFHKENLDAEIQVLREEVHELAMETQLHDNEQQQQQEQKREPKTLKRNFELKKHELNAVQHSDRVQRFKDAFKQKHPSQQETNTNDKKAQNTTVGDEDDEDSASSFRHQKAIQRFKDAFQKKHKQEGVKLQKREILKRNKDSITTKLQDAVNHKTHRHHRDGDSKANDVWRRRPSLSWMERVKRRYQKNDGHDSPINMRQYMYGVFFFVVANVAILQLCIWIGKRGDKGRRDL